MKFSVIIFSLASVGCVALFGSTTVINLEYGTPQETGAFLVYDEVGELVTTGNALSFLGYFSVEPSIFGPGKTVFENFNVVDSTQSYSPDGFLQRTVANLDTSGFGTDFDGATIYLGTVTGINDPSALGSVDGTGYFLASDTNWATFEPGAPLGDPDLPTLPGFVKTFDDIKIGTQLAGEGFEGGVGYKLQAIPEPSAYATILGLLGLGYAVFCRRRRSSSTD